MAKYYIYLKIAAIKNLNYKQCLDFILPYNNKEKYLNKDIIHSLCAELPHNIQKFWQLLLNEINVNNIGNLIQFLDKNIFDIKNGIPYYTENNFRTLQELLRKKEYPKFIETDAAYIEYAIKEKYDFISLSNIIECNQQPFDDIMEKRLYSHEEWIEYIKNTICKYLNHNGEILIYQTGEWSSTIYEKEGFKKYLFKANNKKDKNVALILKR